MDSVGTKTHEKAEKLGRRSAGFFRRFIRWVTDNCRAQGIDQVYFLSREGEFFAEVLQAMQAESARLSYKVLHVSRVSTYLPSLGAMDRDDWDRYLNQYGEQSVSAFLASLGVPRERALALLKKQGVQEDKSIEEQLPAFYTAVTSEELKAFFRAESARARGLLTAYLAQEGLDGRPGTVAVVDIGWRGTIQDNLCYLLPQKTIWGYYLGLIPMLNRQPANGVKQGFINTMPCAAALLKSHTQLEMVCSSRQGSVLGYEEQDGEIVPVREDGGQDIDSWELYARYFQRGVIAGIHEKERAAALLWLTLFPDKHAARAFFAFRYSERFGLGTDMDMADVRFSWRPFMNALRGGKHLKALREYLNGTMWPQGFLRIHGLSALIPAYNIVLLHETGKQAR